MIPSNNQSKHRQMPSTEILAYTNDPEHHHHHQYSFEVTDVEISESGDGMTDDDCEHSEGDYDPYEDENSDVESGMSYRGATIEGLVSRSGAKSYEEFVVMLRNGMLSKYLMEEAHCHHLDDHSLPSQFAAAPDVVHR